MADIKERYGYNGKILYIDLSVGTFHTDERDEIFWRRYGGGGLAGTVLLCEQTKAGIDPLGLDNLLIFTSGVVAGQPAPGLSRFSVIAKSPLTNGIGEARCEGTFAGALKASGYDIIVFKGKADKPVYVFVDNGKVVIKDAADIWGMNTGDCTDALQANEGKNIHVAAIGRAGENLVRFASIVTDRSFQASRMGMGAVMGSKNLKALVIKPQSLPAVYNKKILDDITSDFTSRINSNNLSKWQLDPPGFSCWIYLHGLDTAICVNNYTESSFDKLEGFKEENFLKHKVTDLPCTSCPNNCIKIINPSDARELDERAGGMHQEVTGTMGPNLGIGSLDMVLRFNNLCNQYGMDTVSLGFSISFAMELYKRGILTKADGEEIKFGDAASVLRTIENIALRKGIGNILAEGTKRAAILIGKDSYKYAMHVKGLEMVPFEPRSQTNLALGYAVAPVGPRYDICEHDWDFDVNVGWEHTLNLCRTLGILDRIPMNYIGPEKVRNFKQLFTIWSAADALNMCIFAVAPTRLLTLRQMAEMLHAITGWETSDFEIMRLGERRIQLMRWYNLREGINPNEDKLPERFYSEPIKDGPRKGDVINKEKFHNAINTFYHMMGWDENGIPLTSTLYDFGLEMITNNNK